MRIETLKLKDLNPASYNPRKELKPGDPEFEKLKRSITEFGYVELIIVNERTGNTVISGHQRLSVMKTLGIEDAECVIVDLPPEKEKALNIAMNRISGEWDEKKLALVISDLEAADFDVSLTGFDAAELEDLFRRNGDGPKDDGYDPTEELISGLSEGTGSYAATAPILSPMSVSWQEGRLISSSRIRHTTSPMRDLQGR